MSKSFYDDLNQIVIQLGLYLPLIFLILGFIGFIGNLFTYLQSELRSNTCCIYSLAGAVGDLLNLLVNLLPNYIVAKYGISIPWNNSTDLCRLSLFILIFFPQLSSNCLLLAIIDRFAATCNLTSPIRRILQLKFVPIMIIFGLITCFLLSIIGALHYEQSVYWCTSTNAFVTSILYIILNGLFHPIIMLIFVLLTYRNIHRSHQRVRGTINNYRTQFIVMIFGQIFITAFVSLQWIIYYMYYTFTLYELRTYEQYTILSFINTLSLNIFYLNNVKAFYISLCTSKLFRKTFINGLLKLVGQHRRIGAIQTNTQTGTGIKYK